MEGRRASSSRSAPSASLSSHLPPLTSSHLLHLSPLTHTSNTPCPFPGAALSDNHGRVSLAAPRPPPPIPSQPPRTPRSRRTDADHDGCVHMTRLTYISTSLGVRPRSLPPITITFPLWRFPQTTPTLPTPVHSLRHHTLSWKCPRTCAADADNRTGSLLALLSNKRRLHVLRCTSGHRVHKERKKKKKRAA